MPSSKSASATHPGTSYSPIDGEKMNREYGAVLTAAAAQRLDSESLKMRTTVQ
jgi:hypothetical protein